MRYLAILLLAPWLLILSWAYWSYPKHLPRTAARRLFDVLALALGLVAAIWSTLVGFDLVEVPVEDALGRPAGAIWQQVLPVVCGYIVFTVALLLALPLRHLCWGRRR